MKAVIQTSYGDTSVLELKELDVPKPKDDEVLVKIKTTCVNRTDCAVLGGTPFVYRLLLGTFKPSTEIVGTQFSGVVQEVGKNVEKYKKGDRVFGFDDTILKTYAEYTILPQDAALEFIPEKVSYDDAAAISEGFHYAYNMISKIGVEKGNKIMMNGATGAIGSSTLQILKAMECDVTVTCPTKWIELVQSYKPDKIIDYLKEDFTKQDSDQFHFVIDAVGKSSFSESKHLLKSGGTYVSSELGYMAENIPYALFTPLFSDKKVVFPIPTDLPKSLKLSREYLEKGIFKPMIDEKVFNLDQIKEAFQYVQTGEKIGNVLVIVNKDEK
eukprot:gene7929-12397_t